MAADACETNRLVLPALGDATTQALRRFLPAEASLKNPIDMIASAPPTAYAESMRHLLADDAVDALVVVYVPPLVTSPLDVATAVRDAAHDAKKPILACLIGGDDDLGPARALLRAARLPVYHFPENAILALARAVSHSRWLARPEGQRVEAPPGARAIARRRLALTTSGATPAQARWLDPETVRDLLDAYGIRTPAAEIVASEDAAVSTAERLGFPVALKIVSDTIIHKTDVGGVVLGLANEVALRAAYRALLDHLITRGRSHELRGFLVQKMAPVPLGAVETYVGITGTRDFGQLIAFGLGGTELEVHRDVVFRVNPITNVDAGEMLRQIRGVALLDGFRGRPPVDREALLNVLLQASRLAEDLPEIVELDLNPVLALPAGEGAMVVDARIRVR